MSRAIEIYEEVCDAAERHGLRRVLPDDPDDRRVGPKVIIRNSGSLSDRWHTMLWSVAKAYEHPNGLQYLSPDLTSDERRLILFAAAYAANDQVTMAALAIEAATENDSVDED